MSFRQKLEHRQKPVFSQSLQQSVRILELPLLELKSMVEAEISENPALEELTPELPPKTDSHQEEPVYDQPQADSAYSEQGLESPIQGKNETLADLLLKQLRINAKDEKQIQNGTLIIHHIDENGYLRQSLQALSIESKIDISELEDALKLIQSFEPSGVAARNLKECLLIQLNRSPQPDELCRRLVEDHLDELANRDLQKLYKKLKITPEELTACLIKIQALEPKPGRGFSAEETIYAIPDIFIEERNEDLEIRIKDDVIPVVRVNPVYRNMLRSKKVDAKTKEFIKERIDRANNLLRAIQGRKDTLLKVVSLITETQKEAVINGLEKLKPLSIKEIAQRTGLHESTISRVVANKYIQAPAGIFAIKNLFSTSVRTEDGEDVAAQKIRSKISELIETENKAHPLKDHEIAELINKSEKTSLARRTIAKYRESLKIPPVSKRRNNQT